jgi:hypothetical protein
MVTYSASNCRSDNAMMPSNVPNYATDGGPGKASRLRARGKPKAEGGGQS